MVECCQTISFFRPIVIYNLTLNFISPLETQLSSFRFVVIGTIKIPTPTSIRRNIDRDRGVLSALMSTESESCTLQQH